MSEILFLIFVSCEPSNNFTTTTIEEIKCDPSVFIIIRISRKDIFIVHKLVDEIRDITLKGNQIYLQKK